MPAPLTGCAPSTFGGFAVLSVVTWPSGTSSLVEYSLSFDTASHDASGTPGTVAPSVSAGPLPRVATCRPTPGGSPQVV